MTQSSSHPDHPSVDRECSANMLLGCAASRRTPGHPCPQAIVGLNPLPDPLEHRESFFPSNFRVDRSLGGSPRAGKTSRNSGHSVWLVQVEGLDCTHLCRVVKSPEGHLHQDAERQGKAQETLGTEMLWSLHNQIGGLGRQMGRFLSWVGLRYRFEPQKKDCDQYHNKVRNR